jgi:hypothetical protein
MSGVPHRGGDFVPGYNGDVVLTRHAWRACLVFGRQQCVESWSVRDVDGLRGVPYIRNRTQRRILEQHRKSEFDRRASRITGSQPFRFTEKSELTMSFLFPAVIFLMVLTPVLIPAVITAVHALINLRRNYRPSRPVLRVARRAVPVAA